MHHKISAYIPTYNNSPTIESALQSVQRQRYAVEELFVVDDGSIDDSAQKAERMGVRVIRQPSNLGRGAARARAMLEANTNSCSVAMRPTFSMKTLRPIRYTGLTRSMSPRCLVEFCKDRQPLQPIGGEVAICLFCRRNRMSPEKLA